MVGGGGERENGGRRVEGLGVGLKWGRGEINWGEMMGNSGVVMGGFVGRGVMGEIVKLRVLDGWGWVVGERGN